MHAFLERGGFVKLAWRLGRDSTTAQVTLDEGPPAPARHVLYVRRGYLTYADIAGSSTTTVGQLLVASGAADAAAIEKILATRGARLAGQALRAAGTISDAALDAALRRQAELRLARLAAMAGARVLIDPRAPAPPAHRSGRPVALAAWARGHLEARFDLAHARALVDRLGDARLVLRKDLAPDGLECDETDRRILVALAAPRRLSEIAAAARAPERRLLAFLYVLVHVGALDAPSAAHELLGIPAGSDAAAVKQAYRRRARQLHPDLHPDADPPERRALEAELASVNAAYRQLLRP